MKETPPFRSPRPKAPVTASLVEYLGVHEPYEFFDKNTRSKNPDYNHVLCGLGETPQQAYADALDIAGKDFDTNALPTSGPSLPAESVQQWYADNKVSLVGPLDAVRRCTVALYLKTY